MRTTNSFHYGTRACQPTMPMSIAAVLSRIPKVPNHTNAAVLLELHDYMHRTGAGDTHIKNQLFCNLLFALHLGQPSFFDISRQKEIQDFLDTKRKSKELDHEEKWKTMYNHYVNAIKFLYRWLYNQHSRDELTDPTTWETPAFVRIRHQKSARKSPLC